jgi:NTP pyrophosphatase (non-canonical NTP hydrolase)
VAVTIFDRAIRVWGVEAQWRMVQEECAELIAAVNRWSRGRGREDDVAEELADVAIMVEQAKRALPEGAFDAAYQRKINRLTCRVEAKS